VVKGAEWVMFLIILNVNYVRLNANDIFVTSINCVFPPEVHNNGVVFFIETSTVDLEGLIIACVIL
jgi:hypothetical protein